MNKSRGWKQRKWREQNFCCGICGNAIHPSSLFDVEVVNIDHIRPRSHDGGDEDENLQIVHKPCNTEKSDQCPGCEACAGGRDAYLLWLVLNPKHKRLRGAV